jgi:NAD(P)-dependent dehydrogenase (short-subunit alcohol dehydrogenase family)
MNRARSDTGETSPSRGRCAIPPGRDEPEPPPSLRDPARQPTGHMVDPSEVAAAIAYLAHPSNRSAVGSVLTIDGGLERLRTTPAATPVEEPSR